MFSFLLEQSKNYKISYQHIDLGSLDSVRVFAQRFIYNENRLDILINNAGSYAFRLWNKFIVLNDFDTSTSLAL